MRIVADENIPGLQSMLATGVDLQLVPGRGLTADDLAGAEALLVRSVTRVDAALLAGTPIRFVGSATSGYDHIDTQYLAQTGVAFAHAPGANANSVVEYVLAAIAAIDDCLERSLAGATVGIVGYGHVGKLLAARLEALGIDFCVYDPWLEQGSIANAADLPAILRCDIVTLHPQLTDEQPFASRHLLGALELAMLGAHQLLINASRGPVIDNAALLSRLQAPSPPAVVLDVWEDEPRVPEALLAKVQLGTAHIAGYSTDSKLRGTAMLVAALRKLLPADESAMQPPDTAPLAYNAKLQGVHFMRDVLLAHCPIQKDDTLLRHATAAENTGIAFDGLRRNYAVRHELAGKLIPKSATDKQVALLLALGCCSATEFAQ